jgi:hypothetical protein
MNRGTVFAISSAYHLIALLATQPVVQDRRNTAGSTRFSEARDEQSFKKNRSNMSEGIDCPEAFRRTQSTLL